MAIVTRSPSARTHSCSFEYLRSSGTVLTRASGTTVSLRDPPVRAGSPCDPAVKRCFDYRSGNVLSADADGEDRPELREWRRDIGQRDVLFHGRSVGTARDVADDLAVLGDLVAVARNAALDYETGELPLRSFGLLRGDHVATGEILVELARPGQTCLDRIGGLIDVVAVKGEACLKAERVAGPEPDRFDAGSTSSGEQRVPHLGRVGTGHEDLEAIFAGISGSRHGGPSAGDTGLRDAE